MPLRSGHCYLTSESVSIFRLDDDILEHILKMVDVSTMCTAKACSVRMSRLVRHTLAATQFATRRSLARKESGVDNEEFRFNGHASGTTVWITRYCRNGQERDLGIFTGPAASKADRAQLKRYPLVEWLTTGPSAGELAGLQDWSIENATAALVFVEQVWREQWRPVEWIEGDDENNEALEDARGGRDGHIWEDEQDEATFVRVLETLSLWDDAILQARAERCSISGPQSRAGHSTSTRIITP